MSKGSIPDKVALSSSVTKHRGDPASLIAKLPDDVARRVSVQRTQQDWTTVYRYRLHMDRCAMDEWLNKQDNGVSALVR